MGLSMTESARAGWRDRFGGDGHGAFLRVGARSAEGSAGRWLMAWSTTDHRCCTAYERHGRHRPARAAEQQGARQAQARRPGADPEIGGRECVRVAEGAHGDHLDRPGADPIELRQAPAGEGPVTPGSELQVAVGEGGRQADHGPSPALGSSERGRRRAGDVGESGPHVGEPAVGRGERRSELGHQARRLRARRRRGDLLADHTAQRQLLLVDGPRDAPTGVLAHQLDQVGVVRQRVVDGDRVGVEVE